MDSDNLPPTCPRHDKKMVRGGEKKTGLAILLGFPERGWICQIDDCEESSGKISDAEAREEMRKLADELNGPF